LKKVFIQSDHPIDPSLIKNEKLCTSEKELNESVRSNNIQP